MKDNNNGLMNAALMVLVVATLAFMAWAVIEHGHDDEIEDRHRQIQMEDNERILRGLKRHDENEESTHDAERRAFDERFRR
jgi:nitrogen fixation-related uncharacterized protein